MKTVVILVLIALSPANPFNLIKVTELQSTEDNCYFPLKLGNSWTYKYVGSEHTINEEITEENVLINGKKYFKKVKTYTWQDKTESYYRIENNEFYNYNEKTKSETISIPNEIVVGKTWEESDSTCHYKITNINATIKTPIKTYYGLLQINVKILPGVNKQKLEEYDLFYKKGVGQIAAKGNGKLMTYLTKYIIK